MIVKHTKARTTRMVCSLALTAIAAGGLLLAFGPLNPPAGPVAPSNKTLAEIEPRIAINATNTPGTATSVFRITAAGSYYLTGNVTGQAGKHGIEIVASGVTLDLNGYDLLGVAGSLDGVSVTTGSFTDIAIRNGSVRNWGDRGIDCGTINARNCRIEGIRAQGNPGGGIYVGYSCAVDGCSAYNNGADGFGGTVSSAFTNCTSYSNAGDGFDIVNGASLVGCTAYNNLGNGIAAGLGCTVSHCSVRTNALDGIVVSSACTVTGNTCSTNGNGVGDGAGIHATSTDNRIEGNNCTGADRGIDVDTGGNFISRNTCSGNTTNWDVVAGNVCLVVSGATGAAILGNAGGVAPGSADPNANFTY